MSFRFRVHFQFHPFKGLQGGGETFVMTAMGYNIEGGGGLFPRILKVLGMFTASGDSWDAKGVGIFCRSPLKKYEKTVIHINFSQYP